MSFKISSLVVKYPQMVHGTMCEAHVLKFFSNFENGFNKALTFNLWILKNLRISELPISNTWRSILLILRHNLLNCLKWRLLLKIWYNEGWQHFTTIITNWWQLSHWFDWYSGCRHRGLLNQYRLLANPFWMSRYRPNHFHNDLEVYRRHHVRNWVWILRVVLLVVWRHNSGNQHSNIPNLAGVQLTDLYTNGFDTKNKL